MGQFFFFFFFFFGIVTLLFTLLKFQLSAKHLVTRHFSPSPFGAFHPSKSKKNNPKGAQLIPDSNPPGCYPPLGASHLGCVGGGPCGPLTICS
jgi:hypothetical protein